MAKVWFKLRDKADYRDAASRERTAIHNAGPQVCRGLVSSRPGLRTVRRKDWDDL